MKEKIKSIVKEYFNDINDEVLEQIADKILLVTETKERETFNIGDKIMCKMRNTTIKGTVIMDKPLGPLTLTDIQIEGNDELAKEFNGRTAAASRILKKLAQINGVKNYYNSYVFRKVE